MGGSDQWGNITTGTELIRRKAGGEAFAFTCPLLTKSDGGKFGKTEKEMCGSIRKNQSLSILPILAKRRRRGCKKWIKIFTFLTKTAVNEIIAAHNTDASKRLLQKTLAKRLPHSCMVKKNTIRHWRQQKNYLQTNRHLLNRSVLKI